MFSQRKTFLSLPRKLMGRIATYDNEEQFNELGRFLLNSNLRLEMCVDHVI